MKKIVLFLALSAIVWTSCSDEWDKHYKEGVDTSEIIPMTLYEYLSQEGEFSEFYELLNTANIEDELKKDQYMTIWAVRNENFDKSESSDTELETASDSLLGGYHANYLLLLQSNLYDNFRIPSVNNIYVTITERDGDWYVNDSKVLSSKRFQNGIIYEISDLMRPRINLFDYLQGLNDDYSIIRDSIVKNNVRTFDRENSPIIGQDPLTGMSIYDSIFYIDNSLFARANISSEFDRFTMFLPTNEAIESCFAKLNQQYDLMGQPMTIADTVLAFNWIREAVVHKGVISDYDQVQDRSSLYNRIWRTSVQKISDELGKDLSNGRAYTVTDMKVPNNVIISRIKSYVHYYEFLTEEEREKDVFYNWSDEGVRVSITQGDATPNPTVMDYYRLLTATPDTTINKDDIWVEFSPLEVGVDESGNKYAYKMKVPPGEYGLYMGFRSSHHPFIDVYFGSGDGAIPLTSNPVGTELKIFDSNPWNYDRRTETDPNIASWNGLGGFVGFVRVEGTEMSSFRIKVKVNKPETATGPRKLDVFHWALKPTVDNY